MPGSCSSGKSTFLKMVREFDKNKGFNKITHRAFNNMISTKHKLRNLPDSLRAGAAPVEA